jgi:hypothetical protein
LTTKHFLCLLRFWLFFFMIIFLFTSLADLCVRMWNLYQILVIQPSCEYKSVKYNCGLSLACTLAGGLTKDLCNGGPLWQCCVPKSADNENSVQAPVFSLNDASKLSSSLPPNHSDPRRKRNNETIDLTFGQNVNNPNHFGLGHSRLSSWIVVSHVNHHCQHYNFFPKRIVTSQWPWSRAVFYSFIIKKKTFLYSFLFLIYK